GAAAGGRLLAAEEVHVELPGELTPGELRHHCRRGHPGLANDAPDGALRLAARLRDDELRHVTVVERVAVREGVDEDEAMNLRLDLCLLSRHQRGHHQHAEEAGEKRSNHAGLEEVALTAV